MRILILLILAANLSSCVGENKSKCWHPVAYSTLKVTARLGMQNLKKLGFVWGATGLQLTTFARTRTR
jgi:hypothetical protein